MKKEATSPTPTVETFKNCRVIKANVRIIVEYTYITKTMTGKEFKAINTSWLKMYSARDLTKK